MNAEKRTKGDKRRKNAQVLNVTRKMEPIDTQMDNLGQKQKPKKSKGKSGKKRSNGGVTTLHAETIQVNGHESSESEDYMETLKQQYISTVDKEHIISEKERVQLVWKDVGYTVKVPNPDAKKNTLGCVKRGEKKLVSKRILQNMSGYVPPGCLMGIIGPSGAGKTSFLNILSHRVHGKGMKGTVEINGKKADSALLRKISGFVSQEDVLMGSLTAREALMFAAKLKMGKHTTKEERSKKVDGLLLQLGLYHVRNNFIGFSAASTKASSIERGLSGGERKRVSVALELITDPKILFLDEPTSGLDSFAAKAVVDVLRKLAFCGHTIICTIHQPSADIYRHFDKMMILADGQTVYYGDLEDTIPYFGSIGYQCPPFKNPADYLMKTLHVTPSDIDEEEADLKHVSTDQVKGMIKKYKKSKYHKQAINPPKHEYPVTGVSHGNQVSVFVKFWILLIRSFKTIYRENMLFKSRLIITILRALIGGLVYLRLANDQTGIRDRVSALFFVGIGSAFAGVTVPVNIFPAERGVVFREQRSGLYGSGVYFLSKFVSDLPVNILIPLINTLIAFWMIGWSDSFVDFLRLLLALALVANVAYSFGMLLSASIHDPVLVSRAVPMLLIPFMLFSGFWINTDNIPVYFVWIENISFLRWGFEAMVIATFSGQSFICEGCDYRIPCDTIITNVTMMVNETCTLPPRSFPLPSTFNGGAPLQCSGFTLSPNTTVICPVVAGEQQIAILGFAEENYWRNIGIIIATWFVIELAIYLLLRFHKGKQN